MGVQQVLLAEGADGGAAGGAAGGVLDGLGFSAAWSPSRLLVSTFGGAKETNSGGFYDTWADQTGNGRTASITTTSRPAVSTGGPNSRACGDFDGSNDWLNTAIAMSTFMSSSAGYMIISSMADTLTQNSANAYENAPLIGESGGFMGLYVRNTGTPKTIQAYNWDGSQDTAESVVINTGTAYVVEWWHTGGNLFVCVNNGTPVSVASGNTTNVGGSIGIGHAYTGLSAYFDGKIFEVAIASAVPATRSTIAANLKTYCGA